MQYALKKRLAILASGTGTNALQIIQHFKKSTEAEVGIIAGNNMDAGVVGIAGKQGLPFLHLQRERFYNDGYLAEMIAYNIDLILLAGFMWKVPLSIISAYHGKILNIHPSLLPKFGGKGMFGIHVHKAVLDAGEAESGITIHYVDEIYDHGNIIFQARCPVDPLETPDALAAKIHKLEHQYYPQVVEDIIRKLHPPGAASNDINL